MRTGLPFDDVLAAAQAGAAWAFEVLYRDLSPSVTGVPAAARRGRARRPRQRDLHRRLHRPGRLHAATRTRCVAGSSPSPTAGSSTTGGAAAAVRRWPTTPATSPSCSAATSRTTPSSASAPTPSTGCAPSCPTTSASVLLLRILADLTVEQVAAGHGPVRGRRSRRSSAADCGRCATRLESRLGKSWCRRVPLRARSGDDRGEMTTAADDTADEAAFEAFLAGRPVPEEAADLAAFAGAVRATATQPGRPNAALAELLATGLLTDQSSPSTRTAPSAGSPPRRSRVRRRRRFAMFFPALLAKFLSAGAVAQAATGAGIVARRRHRRRRRRRPAATTSRTPSPPSSAPTADRGHDRRTTPTVTGDDATQPPTTRRRSTAPAVDDHGAGRAARAFDAAGVGGERPGRRETFGDVGQPRARTTTDLRQWLRAQGRTFGSMVRDWAHKKGMDDADLAEEGVDLADLTDEPTTAPVTGETGPGRRRDRRQRGRLHAPRRAAGHGNGRQRRQRRRQRERRRQRQRPRPQLTADGAAVR